MKHWSTLNYAGKTTPTLSIILNVWLWVAAAMAGTGLLMIAVRVLCRRGDSNFLICLARSLSVRTSPILSAGFGHWCWHFRAPLQFASNSDPMRIRAGPRSRLAADCFRSDSHAQLEIRIASTVDSWCNRCHE